MDEPRGLSTSVAADPECPPGPAPESEGAGPGPSNPPETTGEHGLAGQDAHPSPERVGASSQPGAPAQPAEAQSPLEVLASRIASFQECMTELPPPPPKHERHGMRCMLGQGFAFSSHARVPARMDVHLGRGPSPGLTRSGPRARRRPSCSCPGLFSRGCGGALVWRALPKYGQYCYACSRPGCMFKEWVPPPRAAPELEITLVDAGTIRVRGWRWGTCSASQCWKRQPAVMRRAAAAVPACNRRGPQRCTTDRSGGGRCSRRRALRRRGRHLGSPWPGV